MNAGSALGLLAGLGAINALRGGKDGKRFTSLIDMIDGGGAGQSGDKFEGGGLLSMLGNLFAKPYEAQDNVERIAKEAAVNKVVNQPKPNVNQPFIPSSGLGMESASQGVNQFSIPSSGLGMQPQAAPAPQSTTASQSLIGGLMATPVGSDISSIYQSPDYLQYVQKVREMEQKMGLQPFTEAEMQMAYSKQGRY